MCHRLHEPQPRKHGEKQNTNILEMLWCKFLCRNFSRSDPSIQKEFIFWPHRNKEIRGKIDIHKSQKSYGVYFWAANSLDLIHQFRRNLFFGRTATKKSGEKLIYTNPKKVMVYIFGPQFHEILPVNSLATWTLRTAQS